eukprot:TRINITY_DN9064_c0_g1_i1.p1 TRINITY_DN9064_c0_g1~~TRINITY_DN9064_c0_g1_i1.p1  ORF type:complete len:218 (-),score=11.84 TRINITY_DN9064_c0_g1_i1:19-672(-)
MLPGRLRPLSPSGRYPMTYDSALLLIDDDPEFLNVSVHFLKDRGFWDITTTRSSKEALALIGTRTFDVIIADYELPPGQNSIHLLKTLKSQGNETPFIIFTGKSREEVAIEALNNGAAYYLQKGIEIEVQYAELHNMIMQLAEKKRAKERVLRQEVELRLKNEELESFCYSISHVLCVDTCLLYTSDAADDMQCVDLGGRRVIKKKKKPAQRRSKSS